MRRWLAEPLDADTRRALERIERLDDVVEVAVMPDAHLAKDVCIGTVTATRSRIFPSAVGGDIGCGMGALPLGVPASRVNERTAPKILDAFARHIPILKHRTAPTPWEGEPCRLSHGSLERKQAREGRLQLGTVGRGNHFVELQEDDLGNLWLMVHSGSRAMGQSITAHHLAQADRSTRLPSLVADSDAGRAYLSDQRWARAYARENRHRIAKAAVGALREVTGEKSEWAEFFDGDHNHVQREVHAGEALFVHRKGAQSAREGERGIIPGSMGSPSFHVEGRGEASSFCSSSHGAGRALSRTEARRRVSPLGFLQDVEGVWFNPRLASRLREEAPRAYKDIGKVMRAQRDLVRIVRRLRPRLSFKGV